MNFLSPQDDFFQTGNEPIGVRHLSQPYNNMFSYLHNACQRMEQIHKRLETIAGRVEFFVITG